MQELLALTLAGLAGAYLVRRCWLLATGRRPSACAACRACASPSSTHAGHERSFVPVGELHVPDEKGRHA